MAVSAALATVLAVPVLLGAGMVLTGALADPVTRPAAVVDAPRPAAAAPGSTPSPPAEGSPPAPPPGPAPPPRSSPSPPGGGYAWPLRPRPTVVRRFSPGPLRWSPGHRGIDLAGRPGQEVLAAADGRVLFAGPLAGRPVVVVAHADGVRTTYEPVAPGVHVGDPVARGTPLGLLVTTAGHCPAGCLHWGALRGQQYLDPLGLLAVGPAVLLPLSDLPGP